MLLTDSFKTFRDICLETYNLDPANFYSVPESAWITALKMTKVKLELLTNTYILLMVEKGTREDICYLVPIYARIKILYIKNYNKSKDPSYLAY